MPKRIKGITIELDGETKGLDKALRDVNNRSQRLQSELKDVERLLKFDPSNTELLAQKQKILTEQVEKTSDKLDQLRKAEKQVQDQFKRGDIKEEQYRAFQREIADTEASLRQFKKKASKAFDDIDSKRAVRKIDKVGEAFKRAGKKARKFAKESSTAAAGAGVAGAGAAIGLVEGAQDYNRDLARLRTNASNAGRDLKIVEDAFTRITEITGESDAAVETVSNLLASGFSDSQLASMIDEINGAAIKFSDTLKTEGIADGIQETFATGEATGQFGELLERSGIDLETFNTQLKSMKAAGEGANYILNTLSDQGFGKITDKYKELNPEVQKNAEAQAEFQKALADLAIVLTPLVVAITELVTKFIEFAEAHPELVTTAVILAGAFAAIGGAISVLAPLLLTLGAAAEALSIGILPLVGIIAGIVIAIAALITIGVLLYKNWDTIKAKAVEIFTAIGEFFVGIFEWIKGIFNQALDWIDQKTNGRFKSITDTVRSYMAMFSDVIARIWQFIQDTFANALKFVKALLKGDFKGMWEAVKDQMGNIKDTVSDIWDRVMEFFKGIDLREMGRDIIQGLINGVKSMAGRLVDSVKGVVGDAVQGAKNLLGIHSPSTVFHGFGENVDQGFIDGVLSMVSHVKRAGQKMVDAVIPTVPALDAPSFVGGSPTGSGSTVTNNFADMLRGAMFVVREEADIEKIAQAIGDRLISDGRGVGVR